MAPVIQGGEKEVEDSEREDEAGQERRALGPLFTGGGVREVGRGERGSREEKSLRAARPLRTWNARVQANEATGEKSVRVRGRSDARNAQF